MALIPQSGSKTSSSKQSAIVETTETPVLPEKQLDNASFIRDTTIQKSAFSTTSHPEIIKLIQGFLEGTRVTVTYYNRARPAQETMSQSIDYSSSRHDIHTSFTKICNYEITLISELQTNWDEEKKMMMITGEAVLYPGVKPNYGDVFVMALNDNRYGLFRISELTPLSMRQGRNVKINFLLQSFMTDDDFQKLENQTTSTVYFEKTTYLGDTGTLLKDEDYKQLRLLEQYRTVIAKHYKTMYFKKTYHSVLHPNGVYDPYLVLFLQSILTYEQVGVRIGQLHPYFAGYNRSIWCRLLDRLNTRISHLNCEYRVLRYRETYMSTSITSLLNREYIELIPSDDTTLTHLHEKETYVLSPYFYQNMPEGMSVLEKMLFEAITKRTLTTIPVLIQDYVLTYDMISEEDGFYTIPLILYLIDVAMSTLRQT